MGGFIIKRIYDSPEADDGKRILVDRLWPRGVKKADACLSLWMKEVAPSPEIRVWFDHRPDRFEAFGVKYEEELSREAARPHVEQLLEWADEGRVTLLYAAKDPNCNHALILARFLKAYSR